MNRIDNLFGGKSKDGICGVCQKKYIKTSPSQKRCELCWKEYRKAYITEYNRNRRHTDEEFRIRINKSARKSYWLNIDNRRIGQRNFNRRVKILVLEKYGRICACCKEERYEFLAIDHINGGGIKHRKEINKKTLYGWLKANNFPKGFRVLCHNCNSALGYFGYCPHIDLDAHQRLMDSLTLPSHPTPTI